MKCRRRVWLFKQGVLGDCPNDAVFVQLNDAGEVADAVCYACQQKDRGWSEMLGAGVGRKDGDGHG